MDAKVKTYSKLAGLVLWPGLACLSIWLVAGGMPPAMERAFVFALWGVFGMLFLGLFSVAIAPVLFPHGEFKPPAVGNTTAILRRPKPKPAPTSNRLDRICFYVFNPSRLVLILALFQAGRPILGGCIMVGFVGLWMWLRKLKRMVPAKPERRRGTFVSGRPES